MSLFDFLFPDAMQAARLGRLAGASEREAGTLAARNQQLARRVGRPERDVGAPALMTAVVLKRLDEKRHVTRAEVRESIRKLDLLDEARDGRLGVDGLRAGGFYDAP